MYLVLNLPFGESNEKAIRLATDGFVILASYDDYLQGYRTDQQPTFTVGSVSPEQS